MDYPFTKGMRVKVIAYYLSTNPSGCLLYKQYYQLALQQ